jgi:kinesin family protein 26
VYARLTLNTYRAVVQVTEEDIALCMGEMENPLPEVDQESNEEHPLRILSQENLTVVSTFTGMKRGYIACQCSWQ